MQLDAADYVIWRKGLGTTYTQNDYDFWRAQFGLTIGGRANSFNVSTIPEPTIDLILIVEILTICLHPRTRVSLTHAFVAPAKIHRF